MDFHLLSVILVSRVSSEIFALLILILIPIPILFVFGVPSVCSYSQIRQILEL